MILALTVTNRLRDEKAKQLWDYKSKNHQEEVHAS